MKFTAFVLFLFSFNAIAEDYLCQSSFGSNPGPHYTQSASRVTEGTTVESNIVNNNFKVAYKLIKNIDRNALRTVTVEAIFFEKVYEAKKVLAQVIVTGNEGTNLTAAALVPAYGLYYWVKCQPDF